MAELWQTWLAHSASLAYSGDMGGAREKSMVKGSGAGGSLISYAKNKTETEMINSNRS